jgi:RNA recognition motif-containing protein
LVLIFRDGEEGAKETHTRKVYVCGLPPNVTEKPLFDYFSQFGPVHHINVIRDKASGISRGFGFVSQSSLMQ